MMREKSALALIIDELPSQKNIPRDRLIQIVESAVVKAAVATSKNLGSEKNYFASYNEDTGSVDLFESKVVVEEVTDAHKEISLEPFGAFRGAKLHPPTTPLKSIRLSL